MKTRRTEKSEAPLELPTLSAVIERDGSWFVSTCPELGVSSQGRTRTQAYRMLQEAVELWLESATNAEIRRRLKRGARVQELQLTPALNA